MAPRSQVTIRASERASASSGSTGLEPVLHGSVPPSCTSPHERLLRLSPFPDLEGDGARPAWDERSCSPVSYDCDQAVPDPSVQWQERPVAADEEFLPHSLIGC